MRLAPSWSSFGFENDGIQVRINISVTIEKLSEDFDFALGHAAWKIDDDECVAIVDRDFVRPRCRSRRDLDKRSSRFRHLEDH
jgi:hypothetical protein